MEQALRWLQEDEDISSSNIDVGSARSSVVRTSGNNTNAGQIFLAAVIFASLAGESYLCACVCVCVRGLTELISLWMPLIQS